MKSNRVIKDSLGISPSKSLKKGDLVIIDNSLSFMNGEIGIITRVSRKKTPIPYLVTFISRNVRYKNEWCSKEEIVGCE